MAPSKGIDVVAYVSKFIEDGGYVYDCEFDCMMQNGVRVDIPSLWNRIYLDALKRGVYRMGPRMIKLGWRVHKFQRYGK